MVSRTKFSSSSNSTPPRKTCDVFINHRGVDTRRTVADLLYASLQRNGIKTFMDEENLERGELISQQLNKAIEGSRVAIVIFSANYASSCWCLDELQKIFECKEKQGLQVMPVFYGVDPSTVRHQRESFEEAFKVHQDKLGQDSEKVKKWRHALTQVAGYSGWDSKDRDEAGLVESIIQGIHDMLFPRFPLFALEDLRNATANFNPHCIGRMIDEMPMYHLRGEMHRKLNTAKGERGYQEIDWNNVSQPLLEKSTSINTNLALLDTEPMHNIQTRAEEEHAESIIDIETYLLRALNCDTKMKATQQWQHNKPNGYQESFSPDNLKKSLQLVSSFVTTAILFLMLNYHIFILVNQHKELGHVFRLLEAFGFMVFIWGIVTMILGRAPFSRLQSAMLVFWAILLFLISAKSLPTLYLPTSAIIFIGCYMLVEKKPPNDG